LLRGQKNPANSITGLARCSKGDWAVFLGLQFLCVIFLYLGIRVVIKEYRAKKRCGYNFVQGDFEPKNKNIAVMVAVSFFGGLIGSFSGVSAGMVFSPAFVIIGLDA